MVDHQPPAAAGHPPGDGRVHVALDVDGRSFTADIIQGFFQPPEFPDQIPDIIRIDAATVYPQQ